MTGLLSETEMKTYFGESLDEILPRIREELGPDALIVRQREGIVGGIGGFFGKKCVEVEAMPATARTTPAVPPRAVVDAYDTSDGFEPMFPGEDDAPAGELDFDWEQEPARAQNGLEAMLAQSSPFSQSSPFASTLSAALAVEPEPEIAPEAPVQAPPPAAPAVDLSRPLLPDVKARVPAVIDELETLREELLAAAVPVRLAGDILAEARLSLQPFEPDAPMRDLVRRSLTRRIPVARVRKSGRRRIAVIGPAGAGRTLVTASLCSAFAQTGRSVAAMSLEPARHAMQLAELLEGVQVEFEIASAPDLVSRACSTLQSSEILVADVPSLVDGVDPARLTATLRLLKALRPDETHLVLPAATSAEDGQAILASLIPHRLPTRLIISQTDLQEPTGVAVGLALAHRIPVSFVSCGATVGLLRPAEPDALAGMILQ